MQQVKKYASGLVQAKDDDDNVLSLSFYFSNKNTLSFGIALDWSDEVRSNRFVTLTSKNLI